MGALRHSAEGNRLLTILPSGYQSQLGGEAVSASLFSNGIFFFFLVGSLSEGKSEPHAVGWLL